MAKGSNQKLKMLCLQKIFAEETDEGHMLSVKEIQERLNAWNISADRKTLYDDFELLKSFGMDIVKEKSGRGFGYYVGERDFQLPELKLLVDSVQSAKFITDKKSNELIKKLESLVSKYEAKQLHRHVIISGRVKTMNENIYYNVDSIHDAINRNLQIKFKYFGWNMKKQLETRKGKEDYKVSPWALMWNDENYYMIGYDTEECKIKHYRVDKMMKTSLCDEERQGREHFEKIHIPKYTNLLFGMYGGEEAKVTLEAENDMIGILIDRFGTDIPIIQMGENRFQTKVSVAVSRQFFGWIFSLGDGIKITGPQKVVAEMREEMRNIYENYK